MTEKTIIRTMELPFGQEWAWFADSNVIGLSPALDAEGRERAITEVQAHWRRSCIHVVPAAASAEVPPARLTALN